MRIALLLVIAWSTLGSVARAEWSSPFAWLRGKDNAASTQSTKGTGIKTPAVVAKMTGGTKRIVTTTKNLFTPKKPPKKTTGTIAVHKPDRYKAPQQSLLGRIFNPKPDAPPETVGEWMSLKQVRPFGDTKPIR